MKMTQSMLSSSKIALCSGILAVAGLAETASAQAYLSEVTRWNDQDALDPIAPGGVLFVGSSSIRRWEQLQLDFNDYRVIQRGFGGSQFENLNFWVNELVLSYQPSAVVVWEGTNDNTSGETGNEVFADYQAFVSAVQAAQPNMEIVYLGIMPTPSNGPFDAERDSANNQIAAAAALDPKLHYIDLPAAFATLNPRGDIAFTGKFVDPVHLNRAGYDFWTSVIRPQIEAIVAPNKTFTPNPLTIVAGERLLFDFGPSNAQDGTQTLGADANGNVWNNWRPAEGNVAVNAGEHIGDLVDTTGAATGIGMTITGGFSTNGRVNGGLLSPSAALLGDLGIATATEDYFFSGADDLVGGGNDDIPGGFMLTGLDPNRVYEFKLFGSRNTTATRFTEYRFTGSNTAVATLQTSGSNIGDDGIYDGNDSQVAVASGIVPDAFGQVFMDMTVVGGEFAYLNAMEMSVVAGVAIATDPQDTVVDAGAQLVLGSDAAGEAGFAVQWERDGVPLVDDGRITGATTETLTINPARAEDAGRYRLVASLNADSVVSQEAVVGVRRSPLGAADFNNDASVDSDDVLDFLVNFEGE